MKQIKDNQELAADGQLSGVEFEPDNTSAEPFDPASISIEPRVIPMDTLLRRLKKGTIRLAPSFQRNYVWDSVRRSQLIESLMLRIPLPMFYVAANEDGTWDVVDGLQRLTTIRNFVLGGDKDVAAATSFKLEGLEFWGDRFDGCSFADIEANEANGRIVTNIIETEMRFTIINPGTPEEVKRNIFKRINTGGMPLTQQEIRHALYQGHSTRLLEELVESHPYKLATDSSVDDSRMAGRELILRFFSFTLFDADDFSGDMDKLLSNTMRVINAMPNLDSTELQKIFRKGPISKIKLKTVESLVSRFNLAMSRSHDFFAIYAFRKATKGQRRTPVNKALFEAWGSILGAMSEREYRALKKNQKTFLTQYEILLSADYFDRAISRDASSIFGVRERYKLLHELIHKHIK